MGTLITPDTPAPETPAPDGNTPPGDATPPTPNTAPPAPSTEKDGQSTPPKDPPTPETPPETPPPTPEPTVPETYALTLPEDAALDASILERTASLAKELKLTNDSAQRVVTAIAAEAQSQLDVIKAAESPGGEAWKARVQQYETDALEAADLGNNDPARLQQVAIRAKQVAEKIGGKGILEFLNLTGAGSHPEFLRMFGVRIYNAFGEGEFTTPGAVGPVGSKDPAAILFGGTTPTPKE